MSSSAGHLDPGEVLSSYTKDCLQKMWFQLRSEQRAPSRREALEAGLIEALQDPQLIRSSFRQAPRQMQIAVRMVQDCGEEGMAGHLLLAELQEIQKDKTGSLTVIDALNRGCLLGRSSIGYYHVENKVRFNKKTLGDIRVYVNPLLVSVVSEISVPGELSAWSELKQALPKVKLTGVSTPPQDVLTALSDTCRVIEAQPQLYTAREQLRVAALRRINELTSFDPAEFIGWLNLSWRLDVITTDEGAEYWRPGELAVKLVTAPIQVLSGLTRVFRLAAARYVSLIPGYQIPMSGLRYLPNRNGIINQVATKVLDNLQQALTSFLKPNAWFSDHELQPLIKPLARWACNQAMLGDRYYWYYQPDRKQIEKGVLSILGLIMDLLKVLGLVDRGRYNQNGASRLTELGVWLLRHDEAAAESAAADRVMAGLHQQLRWQGDDGLLLIEPRDTPLVMLMLGSLAEPVDRRQARISAATIRQTLEAGESADELSQRLARLVPDSALPPVLMQALAEAREQWQPVEILPDLAGIEVRNLDEHSIEELRSAGFMVIDKLVLGSQTVINQLLASLAVQRVDVVDYDQTPVPSCTLADDLELQLPSSGFVDLRLLQLLSELEVTPGATGFKLDPEALPGVETLDDSALDRYLKNLLRRLSPHIAGGISDAVRTRMLAAVGVVAAPKVEEHVVLGFDSTIAKGLADLQALGEEAEPLSGGRFLVARSNLTVVEEKLSELGIPFPAEHSSLRQTAQAQVALGRLEEAVAELEEANAVEVPAAAAPKRHRRKRQPVQGLEEAALAAIRQASAAGGRGASLGEIAVATRSPKEELRPVLKALVKAGKATLSGHARGARYRL